MIDESGVSWTALLRLEKAAPEDAGILAQVAERAFHSDVHYGAPNVKPGGPPGYNTDLGQLRLMMVGDYYKVILNERIVGGITVRLRGYQYNEVVQIFVDPLFQNQGVGTQIFQLLWGQYPDVRRWTLGTPAWNRRTPSFYRKVGFVEVGKDGYGGILFERKTCKAG